MRLKEAIVKCINCDGGKFPGCSLCSGAGKIWVLEPVPEEYEQICPGVFVSTSEFIISEQKNWDDEDESRDIDFSTSKFWVTTDDGAEPEGFDDYQEILEKYGEGDNYTEAESVLAEGGYERRKV